MAGLIRLSIFVVLMVLLPDLAASDLIFLKDGSQVKAQNVWEENDRIHFTLPGYDGIVVTYAKEIVLRIEKEKAVTGAGASPPEARPQRPATESAAGEKALSGIQFYDPRRHTKYQTGTTTSYHTLKEAVDDLATKFDKTPRWVELNLGDTNDLGLRGGVLVYAAQTIPQTCHAFGVIDAEIAEKIHLWTELFKF